MNIEEIKHELQEQRYFINRISHNGEKVSESLCKKIDGSNDYEVLRAVNTPKGLVTAYDNCLSQVNNQSLINISESLKEIKDKM